MASVELAIVVVGSHGADVIVRFTSAQTIAPDTASVNRASVTAGPSSPGTIAARRSAGLHAVKTAFVMALVVYADARRSGRARIAQFQSVLTIARVMACVK